MKLMTRLTEAFNSIKEKFTRTERDEAPGTEADAPLHAGAGLQMEANDHAGAAEQSTTERDALTQNGTDTETAPGRMTEEYKAWLQQQREAADAANAGVSIDNVQ